MKPLQKDYSDDGLHHFKDILKGFRFELTLKIKYHHVILLYAKWPIKSNFYNRSAEDKYTSLMMRLSIIQVQELWLSILSSWK